MCGHDGSSIVVRKINNEKPLSILDIGAGGGYWGFTLKAYLKHLPEITGVELNPEVCDRLRILNIYDRLIEGNVFDPEVRVQWNDRHYDLAILSHFVEHVEKEKAIELLKYLIRVCDQVFVLTPEGDALHLHERLGFSHISTWKARDFKKIGMKVKHIAFGYRAGRVVSFFEKAYFWLKRMKRCGILIAWTDAR